MLGAMKVLCSCYVALCNYPSGGWYQQTQLDLKAIADTVYVSMVDLDSRMSSDLILMF